MSLALQCALWCRRSQPLHVVVVAWLCACASPSRAAAQEIVVPQSRRSPAEADGRAPAPAAAGEWTIERVVAASLSQHPLVDAARARVDAARGERASVGAFPNPIVTLWVENATFPGQQPVFGLTRETSAYVTFPVEQLIQRGSRADRAQEEVIAAEATSALTRRAVAAGAVRAFFRVALAQALADEAEENRARLDQLASYNRVRVAEGVTAEGELLRIQIELDHAMTGVVVADVDLTRSRAELQPYVGGDPAVAGALSEIRVIVPGETSRAVVSIPPLEDLLEGARALRPELLAGRARAAAAVAATSYEHKLNARQFGATFGSKRTGGMFSMIASVSLAVPLFNQNRGGIERATNDRVAADAEIRWTERTIAAEVQGAHRAATQLARQLETLQQSFLTRADAVYRFTLGAYQEGGATLLQVLDATRMLADAKLTYLRTLLAERLSLFELALATGAEPERVLELFHAWSASTVREAAQGGQS